MPIAFTKGFEYIVIFQDKDKDVRVGVLRTALKGGSADLPGCDTDSLATASSQFIEEMEDQDVIIDRQVGVTSIWIQI